jgi:hypothetical protein
MKSYASMSLLLAGLVATAGAVQAQQSREAVRQEASNLSAATATTNVASRSGEFSTWTNGVPNLLTSNPQPGEYAVGSREAVRLEAMNHDRANATSGVPPRAGEVSTMVGGVPNIDPNNPALSSSRGVYASTESDLRVMGAPGTSRSDLLIGVPGARRSAGFPSQAPAGTPSVFQGGTPE